MMTKPIWNLESLFAGGSSSPDFAAFVEEAEAGCAALLKELQTGGDSVPDERLLAGWTAKLQETLARLREADSFVACLTSQNLSDKRAVGWTEKIQTLAARYKQASDLFDAKLSLVPDSNWEAWMAQSELAAVLFPLSEKRDFAKEKLPPALEAVASELAVDGYHGWGEHYNTVVGRIAIAWEEDGNTVHLSAGQAANKLDDPSQAVRDAMAAKWEAAWAEQADLGADALNRIAGFRLKLYGLRGWSDPLKEPLAINRMSRQTLDAMWEAVEGSVEPLKRYLALKARMLGKDKLSWHDVDAPVASTQSKIPYNEAASLITDAFAQFSPRLAELARTAFADDWIEAEDRPGKRREASAQASRLAAKAESS